MKTTIKLFALSLFAILFTSCGYNLHGDGGLLGKRVNMSPSIGSTKGGMVTKLVTKPKHQCGKCGSTFCPKPECCGAISNAVLSRATGQSGTGEPHIGLIPTMKTLAP